MPSPVKLKNRNYQKKRQKKRQKKVAKKAAKRAVKKAERNLLKNNVLSLKNEWHFEFLVVVAQLVRAPGCGSGGRGFKSHQSPHLVLVILLIQMMF